MSGADNPLSRFDGAGISCLHAGRSRLLENVAAVAIDQRGEPGDVFPRVELRLVVDSDRGRDRVGKTGSVVSAASRPARWAASTSRSISRADPETRYRRSCWPVRSRSRGMLLDDVGHVFDRLLVRARVAARGLDPERVDQFPVDEAVADRELRSRVAGGTVTDAADSRSATTCPPV